MQVSNDYEEQLVTWWQRRLRTCGDNGRKQKQRLTNERNHNVSKQDEIQNQKTQIVTQHLCSDLSYTYTYDDDKTES